MLASLFSMFDFLDITVTGSALCTKNGALPIFHIVYIIITILKIAIPVIIVILGMFDLGKAVMAGEEKDIKEAQKMLIKRLIYGLLVFFLVTIVQVVFGLISANPSDPGAEQYQGTEAQSGDWKACWDCAITGSCGQEGQTGNTNNGTNSTP